MSYELFIGQNNETKQVETDKISNIIARYYDGATFSGIGLGLYKGEIEKNITVIVNSDFDTLKECMEVLKVELDQESIAYRKSNEVKFYPKND